MIVVDTNVIASMWAPNDMDEWVYKVLKKDEEWVTPFLWRSEFRSVLSIYLRKGILELSSEGYFRTIGCLTGYRRS